MTPCTPESLTHFITSNGYKLHFLNPKSSRVVNIAREAHFGIEVDNLNHKDYFTGHFIKVFELKNKIAICFPESDTPPDIWQTLETIYALQP